MSSPETRLQELGITLPTPPKPVAKYKPAVLIGNVLYVSGHGPAKGDPALMAGKLGATLTLEQGKECAKLVGINILATVKNTLAEFHIVHVQIAAHAVIESFAKIVMVFGGQFVSGEEPDFLAHSGEVRDTAGGIVSAAGIGHKSDKY